MNIFEQLTGMRIVKKGKVALMFEEIHLQRFFQYYEIDCVFDVGANDGQYATMLRERVGYNGLIVSFEPIPACADTLRKKSASDPKWHVEQLALDKISRKTVFNIMQGKQFSSLHEPREKEVNLFHDKNKIVEGIQVETVTLNEMFSKYEELLKFKKPFLKMDTQGHDLDVAQGVGETLKSFVGLQSELSIKPIYENTSDFTKVIEYYNSQGFELSAFVPNNEGHFPRLIEIDCIMYNKKFTQ